VDKLGIADDEYLSPLHFNALISLLSTVHLLGIDDSGLANLVTNTVFDASAALANKLLKSRLGDSSWQKALRKINDAMRLQQRDRLVDFLQAREGLYDSNALYKHYLIDFEMSPCMNTTRMLQSTAAVQLFVQRCLFNVEQPNVMQIKSIENAGNGRKIIAYGKQTARCSYTRKIGYFLKLEMIKVRHFRFLNRIFYQTSE